MFEALLSDETPNGGFFKFVIVLSVAQIIIHWNMAWEMINELKKMCKVLVVA
jgi:hypothetical protein